MSRLINLILLISCCIIFRPAFAGETGHKPEGSACSMCHNTKGELSEDIMELAAGKNSSEKCLACHAPEGIEEVADKRRRWDYKKRNGEQYSQKVIQQEMILIKAGEFYMGNNGRATPVEGAGNPDETPLHKVYLDSFYIYKYEVTNAHYREFVDATNYSKVPRNWKKGFPEGLLNHPVVYVNWHSADEYCRWAGKRLPSESEWEKAARGTDARSFPWGPEFDINRANTPQIWLRKDEKGSTLPVGSFKNGASPYGLMDMAGNVYEWVNDWYLAYPGNHAPNEHYGKKNKILRGGSWYDCLTYGCGMSSPVYNRARVTPRLKNSSSGFRCASDQLNPKQVKIPAATRNF